MWQSKNPKIPTIGQIWHDHIGVPWRIADIVNDRVSLVDGALSRGVSLAELMNDFTLMSVDKQ